MVRRKKKIADTPEDYKWPFEISIKLSRSKPKIAFLSGCARDYYPDDPGFSKFGLTYGLPDPKDTVECHYYPADDRLNKPISDVGYGIGGLSAYPRFPRDHASDNPAPNAYQGQLVPPRVRDIQKAQKMSWKKLVQEYEELEEKEMALEEEAKESRKKGDVRLTMPRKTVFEAEIKDVAIKRPHCLPRIAFGRSPQGSRFYTTSMPGYPNPGAGTYNPGLFPKKSFQITNPQGVLIPRVRINCIPGTCDSCMSCGIRLFESDYYQTIQQFKVKNAAELADVAKYKMTYLSMCRDCYCRAAKHGYGTWIKAKIPQLFTKARHCNSIHDHQQGQSEYLARASCKGILHLTRKELQFSKFFKDNPCREAI